MIYRNDVLIDWSKGDGLSRDEKLVREEIIEIRNQYFADGTEKRVRILYPKGEISDGSNLGYERPRMFQVPLNSADGQWRWSANRMTNKGYVDHHRSIRHGDILHEKDVEFLWFLKNRSAVMNKYVFIEDKEADAKGQVDEIATDADIRFMIMGSKSPIAKNDGLLREVADIFGVRGVETMQPNQVKVALLDALKDGQSVGDKFVNYERFDALTDGDTVRRVAHTARRAIADRIVGYKDSAWWVMAGRNYEEKLMTLKSSERQFRDQVFIDEVGSNPSLRDRLFSAMGEEEEITMDVLRELDRPALQKRYRDLTGEFKNIKKEELVALICDELELEYVQPT